MRTDLIREDGLVIEKSLRPIHQGIDIFWSRQLGWPLVLDSVFPQIFVASVKSEITVIYLGRV